VGTPAQIAAHAGSHTGRFLSRYFAGAAASPGQAVKKPAVNNGTGAVGGSGPARKAKKQNAARANGKI
jgi:hypothetical protein